MMAIRDGDWTLVNHDAQTGRTVWHYFDGEVTHQRTDYPVENIIKDNAAARSDMQGKNWDGGRRVASIPLNIYFDQLAQAQVEGDASFVSRWLNDGDNAKFRTFEGQV